RFSEALMRYEALRAYLMETAAGWRPAAGAAYAARVLRTKTHVTQESTRLCAELFALSGGRPYSRTPPLPPPPSPPPPPARHSPWRSTRWCRAFHWVSSPHREKT